MVEIIFKSTKEISVKKKHLKTEEAKSALAECLYLMCNTMGVENLLDNETFDWPIKKSGSYTINMGRLKWEIVSSRTEINFKLVC